MGEKYEALVSRLKDINNIGQAEAVLHWDMETQMPEGGAEARGDQLTTLSRIRHEMFTSDATGELLEQAAGEMADADYHSNEASLIRVVQQDYEEETKLPTEFVAEFTGLVSRAHHSWVKARAASDFSIFAQDLGRIVEMSRQKAEYRGYDENPYDALLQEYERSMTSAQVKALFDGHKQDLIDLVAAIKDVADRVDDTVVHQPLPVENQRAFGEVVAEAIGYDFNRGRLDESVHPFSTSFSKTDARITTRYDDGWLNPALFGTMHECGHAMYEQGIADDLDGSMIGTGTSLSVHESQSRTWENLVGRSMNFWQWAYPRLVEYFPHQFQHVDVTTFYRAVNRVAPSLIRVEADECTYNLHIMLRFEIEQAIIRGDIPIAEIPQTWNDMFNEFLGITPPDDARGCLQDIHWSMGGFGYFSTYALGNLLSAQYYNKALQDVPSIPDDIAQGNFATLLAWSNENIHQHGRKYDTNELTQRVTGEDITSRYYIAYLKEKFGDLYGL
ncbi:MAG: carboxypeptidase M32 [Chloroflexota bacterium]